MKRELMLLRTRLARKRLTRAVLVLLAKQAGVDVQEVEYPGGCSAELAEMHELEALATAAEKAAGIDADGEETAPAPKKRTRNKK